MRSLKSTLSLIFALTALLVSYQVYLSIDGLTKMAENRLNQDYSIIVATHKDTPEVIFKNKSHMINSVQVVDAAPYVDYLKTDLSAENFKLLQDTLPKFNRVKLTKYPSKEELVLLTERLKTIPGVLQVEAFTKSQTTAYTLLSALKAGSIAYAGAVFIFTLLLFAKYMEVWRHEHITRMRIMALFGAPVWMRSMALVKMALISSIVSVALAIAVVYGLAISPDTTAWLASVGLPGPLPFDPIQSLTDFAVICLAISSISIGFVAFQGVE
ncbi:MAG: hypothetical protein RL154_330 [Pseudomonadota bacterium]|jgi:cell division transport system permease protein